ncbi:hypothetical protein ACFP51_21715 [Streptomyces pratens]|uniref:Uncharacterized protein n=1 Tax=Streptomyces pratens TaxID=887456 RepID=A0ABW1LXB8_9ACTN
MSGDKNKPDPYQEERQEALAQNGTLDAVTNMTKIVNPFGPFGTTRGIHFGSTSFEGYDLNDMVDIVESAGPELLESASKALVDARDAIRDAAGELERDIEGIDWKGESRTAFTTWATSLVKTAEGIADYADIVGTQVMAAGSGLASVRKSMPPRDSRTDPKPVEEIPEAKRVDSNDEYTAAVKAEKHRQEAINQMYRLASFYTVSAGTMAKAEEPVFPKMPDAGVPAPPPTFLPDIPGPGHESRAFLSDARTTPQNHADVAAGRPLSGEQQSLVVHEASDSANLPQRPVGTEIASVGTLLPQEAVKPTNLTSPSTTGPTALTGPVPPMAPSAVPPTLRGPVGRAPGPSGMSAARVPPSVQGRAGGTPGSGPASRTGTGPVSQTPRTTTSGPMGSRGTGPLGQTARTSMPGQAGGSGTGPMGRGIVGGTPKSGGPVTGPVGGTPRGPVGALPATPSGRSGTGRTTDGVVGGRPVTGAVPGSNASRLPRGTVIGGEGTSAPRTAGQKSDQRGVIGAPSAMPSRGQSPRRPAASFDGVVGTPNGKASSARSGQPTAGGPITSRDGASKKSSDKNRSRSNGRRGDAPTTD